MFRTANYLKSVCVAAQRAPGATLVYTAVCFLIPWVVQCVEHPSDAVRVVRLATPWPGATRLMGEFLRDVITPLFAGEGARSDRAEEIRV